MNINDMKEKGYIKNNPIISAYKKQSKLVRETVKEHSQSIRNELTDLFSSGIRSSEKKQLSGMIKEAISSTNDLLYQFDFPIAPQLTFNRVRNVRYASHEDSEVVSGCIILGCKITSMTGVDMDTEIPINVDRGEIMVPSVIFHNGRESVISQSTVDEIVNRNTSYSLPQLREQFKPPYTNEEAKMAVESRNEIGWQPRKPMYMDERVRPMKQHKPTRIVSCKGTPTGYRLITDAMNEAQEKGLDTFPRPIHYLLREYVRPIMGEVYQSAWEIPLVNDGYALNAYGMNRGRPVSKKGSRKTSRNRFEGDAEEFVRYIEGGVLLEGCVEIDMGYSYKKDVVYAGVIHDGSGYTPGMALFVGDEHEDHSLQEAYSSLETNIRDGMTEEDWSELEKDAEGYDMEPDDLLTEGFDGKVFIMTKKEFLDSINKIEGINRERINKVLDPSDFEEEVEEEDEDQEGQEEEWNEDLKRQEEEDLKRQEEEDSDEREASKKAGFDSDESLAAELYDFIMSDESLSGQKDSISKNMNKFQSKGTYMINKAIKGWMYLVDSGARNYAKEHGNGGSGKDIFPSNIRTMVAEMFADEWESQNEGSDMEASNRKAGRPGKFEGVADEYLELAENLYEEGSPDDEASETQQGNGYYMLFFNVQDISKNPEVKAAILYEGNQGFVDIYPYSSNEEAQKEFDRIADEIAEEDFEDEDDDFEEDPEYSTKRSFKRANATQSIISKIDNDPRSYIGAKKLMDQTGDKIKLAEKLEIYFSRRDGINVDGVNWGKVVDFVYEKFGDMAEKDKKAQSFPGANDDYVDDDEDEEDNEEEQYYRPKCHWTGDDDELVSKTDDLDDQDFSYCPKCNEKVEEE